MKRQIATEGLGTALLLIGVVGSGIMAETLADGNTALALLANAVATGCMLFVIITILGRLSGAHFNPMVSLFFAWRGELDKSALPGYIGAQVIGGILGVWACHVMFDMTVLQFSTTVRTGTAQWFSEIIASFGLLFVILGGLRARADLVPMLVAMYITGAYWFTSSTSFANPAVTIARMFSDSFAGIRPMDAPGFIVAQIVALIIAIAVLPWLLEKED